LEIVVGLRFYNAFLVAAMQGKFPDESSDAVDGVAEIKEHLQKHSVPKKK
jgi:hypothetical protein